MNKEIGKIGGASVYDYNGTPCIDVGSVWFSPKKAKAALANIDKLRQFVAQYDKGSGKTSKAEAISSEAIEANNAKIAELKAQIATMKGQGPGGRFQPQTEVAAPLAA